MLIILAAASLIAPGCRTSVPVLRDQTFTFHQIKERLQIRATTVKTLHGKGTITVESKERSDYASFDVFLKKPDSVRVEFWGMFGLHAATLSLSPDRFIFYNRMENSATIGKPDGHTLQNLFRLKMEFREIVDAFTGEFTLDGGEESLLRFNSSDEYYSLALRDGEGTREYRIDNGHFFVSGYRLTNGQGVAVLTATAQEPVRLNDVSIPTWLRIVFPAEQRSVTIVYDDVVINRPVQCSFTLPKHVEYFYQ